MRMVVDTPMFKDFVAGSTLESKDVDSVGSVTPGHRYCELNGSLWYIANTT